jgi:hypothetical protein
MLGSLSVANIAVSLTNVAVVDSVEVIRSAVYNSYNTGPRALPWCTPAFWEEFCVLRVNFHEKVSALWIGFE